MDIHTRRKSPVQGPGGGVRFYYAKADTPRTPQGRRSSPARGGSVAGVVLGGGVWSVPGGCVLGAVPKTAADRPTDRGAAAATAGPPRKITHHAARRWRAVITRIDDDRSSSIRDMTRDLTWRSGRGRGPRTDRPTAPRPWPRPRQDRHVRSRIMTRVADAIQCRVLTTRVRRRRPA